MVELLVVIAIIGLLAGMVVVSMQNIREKARDAQRVSDINSIVAGLGMYHNDFNAYPIYDGYITGSDTLSTALKDSKSLNGIPTDPLNTDNSRYYYQSTDGEDYYLQYYLETDSIHGKVKGLNYVVP